MEPIRVTHSNANDQLLYFTSSSFTSDNRGLVFISDRTGHPNIFVLNLITGEERQLTFNAEGYLKSYPYFRGQDKRGLGKASVSFHPASGKVYYLQGRQICCVDLKGKQRVLAEYPDDQITGYTDISYDGDRLCLATIDDRAFADESAIDKCCQEQNLNSYLRIYETDSGKEIISELVPKAWVTHVQFSPLDKNIILYNHEWCRHCGVERMWLWNGLEHRRLRQSGDSRGPEDWACHEIWDSTGRSIIYHGGYEQGSMFVGKVDADGSNLTEISLDKQYTKYGHFITGNNSLLVTDGYYQKISNIEIERVNSLIDKKIKSIIPQVFKTLVKKILKIKSNGEWISILKVDWEKREIKWIPLCKHGSSWSSQDAHPHPIFNNHNNEVFFTSDRNGKRSIYKLCLKII